MNTYFVSGTLIKEDLDIKSRRISQEVEAADSCAAIDLFEVDGWEFDPETLVVWRETEAAKMEASGQPTLFNLPERQFRTTDLAAEDFERREAWRRYQVHCARLINTVGLEKAKKMRVKK